MLVVMLIAYLATLALTVVLSLILTPLLFLLQLPVAKLKGRYWKINKSSEKGNEFLEYIKEHHRRYRLYQSDINKVPPAKKVPKKKLNDSIAQRVSRGSQYQFPPYHGHSTPLRR